jgi:hypothetical protein
MSDEVHPFTPNQDAEERERGLVSSNPQPPFAALAGSVFCFNCKHWIGRRQKQTAYCLRLNLSGKDAVSGDMLCVLWEMLHGTKEAAQ